jgi:hypothetical protein
LRIKQEKWKTMTYEEMWQEATREIHRLRAVVRDLEFRHGDVLKLINEAHKTQWECLLISLKSKDYTSAERLAQTLLDIDNNRYKNSQQEEIAEPSAERR